jgi:hypothetical protein
MISTGFTPHPAFEFPLRPHPYRLPLSPLTTCLHSHDFSPRLSPLLIRNPSTVKQAEADKTIDSLFLLRKRFEDIKLRSPSTDGNPSDFAQLQAHHNGPMAAFPRPPEAAPEIPVTLLDPVLARFLDNCNSNSFPVSKVDNEFAYELSRSMSKFYDSEAARATEFRRLLQSYDIPLVAAMVERTSYTTDGDLRFRDALYSIAELKLEIGSKGAEPLLQSIIYYTHNRRLIRKDWPDSFRHPCIVVYLTGQLISGSYFVC